MSGLTFVLTDSELIQLLCRRIDGISIFPPDLIHEVDLYATEPFNLDRQYFVNGEKDSEGFFFTPRRPTSNKPSDAHRLDRMADSGGKWVGMSKDTPIEDPETGRPIGHMNSFAFKLNHGGASEDSFKNVWIMHEYSINRSQDLALCVIYRMEPIGQAIKKIEDGIGIDINQAIARFITF